MQSSRQLEREAQRNVELMWLTGKLAPDHKTIANFRKDNGSAIQAACAHFIVLYCQVGLFTHAVAAVDGNKLKALSPCSSSQLMFLCAAVELSSVIQLVLRLGISTNGF